MIVNTEKKVELGPDDRAALKEFLDSQHGKIVLSALGCLAPETLDVGTSENLIATSQQRKGYEKCIENLLLFVTPDDGSVVSTPASEYPPLDDEAAWDEEKRKQKASEAGVV